MEDYTDSVKHIIRRRALVDSIRHKGIDDERVLKALANVPRQFFMPEELRDKAYIDKAFPIGEGQTISQPYTVAYQSELLDIEPGRKVLEIGTGSAYQAAILAEMGAEVYSIERQKKLYEKVQELSYLDRYKNLHLCYGDGFLGWPEQAPFDRILITAAPSEIPFSLVNQLTMGGFMVLPVGKPGFQRMMRVTRKPDGILKEEFDLFSFVPMLPGKHQ